MSGKAQLPLPAPLPETGGMGVSPQLGCRVGWFSLDSAAPLWTRCFGSQGST